MAWRTISAIVSYYPLYHTGGRRTIAFGIYG